MHGTQNTCLNACHTPRKKRTSTHACAPVQQCRSFFAMEAIANLSWVLREHRAGCRCRSLLLPVLLSRPNSLPVDVRLRDLSKSTLAHDAVPAAVSHKHHSIIRVGAGLIQMHSKRDHGAHPSQKSISTIFSRAFICMCACTDKCMYNMHEQIKAARVVS